MFAEAEPPVLLTPPGRPAAAGRVALGLVLFGLLDLVQGVMSIIAALKSAALGLGVQINLPLGFLGLWFAAWLVWHDKRIIWPIMAYLAAAGLGLLCGSFLAAGLGVPFKLVRAFAINQPGWAGFYAAYLVLLTIFLGWILTEARRVPWPANFRIPQTRWLQLGAFAGYSAVLSAAGVAVLLLVLHGDWTKPALERARKSLGDGYDYQVLSYNFRSVNGHSTYHAVVLAYTDTQFDSIQLNWED